MATTRNLHQIDEALQRPGRMDRIFHLQRPTQVEREKILQIAAKETMDDELIDFVDWKKVVSMTLSHRFLLLMCLLKLSLAFAYLWRHLLCYYYLINKMSSPNKLFSLLVVVIYMFLSVGSPYFSSLAASRDCLFQRSYDDIVLLLCSFLRC